MWHRLHRENMDQIPRSVTWCTLIGVILFCRATPISACGGVFTAPEGTIKSPGHPGSYPNGQECVYIIRREPGERITLAFWEFDLEDSSLCLHDFLQIQDGDSEVSPFRKRLCGSELPTEVIKSFGSSLWILFKSDFQENAGGFVLSYTSVKEKEQFLLLSMPGSIHFLHSREGGSMRIPIPGVFDPWTVGFDPLEDRIYWADFGIGEIRSAFRNGADWKTLVSEPAEDTTMTFALDPVSRLLVYGESGRGSITVMSLLTMQRRTVLTKDVSKPVSIVLDHHQGLLFWVDLGTRPRISRAGYDGNQRRDIVTRYLITPRCLALDTENQILYWVDSTLQLLEWTDYEGKRRSSLVDKFRHSYFIGITATRTHLHVVDWGHKGIGESSKQSILWDMNKDGSNTTAQFSSAWPVHHIHHYDETEWNAGRNQCREKNGGCSDICIPRGDGQRVCLCPHGQVLQFDGTSCRRPPVDVDDCLEEDDCYVLHFDDDDDDYDENFDPDTDTFREVANANTPQTHLLRHQTPGTPRTGIPNSERGSVTGHVPTSDLTRTPPTTAKVRLQGPRPFYTDGSKVMTLTCETKGGAALVRWTGASCRPVWDDDGHDPEKIICQFQPRVPQDDGLTVGCKVTFQDGSFGADSFLIRLNYPPPMAPIITGYQTGQVLKVGDTLEMICTVTGGKPLVSSVDFSCFGHLDTEPDEETTTGVHAIVKLERLKSFDNGVTCVCSAEWNVPEMYAEKASVTLHVLPRARDEF